MPMPNIGKNVEKPYYSATLSMAKNSPRGGLALDIGCGENPYTFQKYFSNYIGMDINISVLKKVSQDLPGASLICASGSGAPFRDESFDLIICTEVLEHLVNPEEMISEIGRVLTRGGKAVISIPSLSLPQTIILWFAYKAKRISEKPYQSPDHLREYAKFKVTPHFEETSNLFKLFRMHKLEILDVVTAQQLYTKPKIVYNIFLSKIEKAFEKFFSKHLIGHYTILEVGKKQS
ncbi:MAG: methyltransferase domain-containing protein [Candidatus Bathyarchaeota archaeon]|nr:methyltransferase domain-containing protein [Candidatus Bathyarchaeota archaeon]